MASPRIVIIGAGTPRRTRRASCSKLRTAVEIESFGARQPATVAADSLFDPGMTRLKS